MNLRVIASLSSALSLQAFGQFQAPIDEKWVLAEDKQDFLQSLTPGTDDYYFFHALHQQNNGDRQGFRKTMQDWDEHKKARRHQSARFTQLENRQVLLDYEAGVKGSDLELQRVLNITKQQTYRDAAVDAQLPSEILATQISESAFERELNIKDAQRLLALSTQTKLEMLVAEDRVWSKQQRDSLLRQVQRADLPHIEKLIEANFNDKQSLEIRNIACAPQLSNAQLTSLHKKIPQLLNDSYFVDLVIKSMQRNHHADWVRDPQLHLEWLTEVDGFTQSLPELHNSLKAHILYHRLRLSHETDSHPVDAFVRYMKLPRSGWISPLQRKNPQALVQLDRSYDQLSGCSPIANDQPLIDSYLDTLLADSDNHATLSQFFKKEPFEQRVSRAQLLAGVDPAQLSHPLNATEFEKLRDAKEITIAASTPSIWSAEDAVTLNVDLKNIDQLTVSIYALDSLRYMEKTGKAIDDDLDLSSLIPNISRTIDTKKSPFLRHRSALQLPELEGLGCWMVEVHGNGQRATALVRKGELHHSTRDTGQGQEIFVSDYNGNPLKGVLAVIDGKKQITDENGTVTVPYSGYAKRASAYLHRPSLNGENGITRKIHFDRKKATPALDLSIISHPEQWVADEKATFYYKPSLRINQHAGSLKLLQSAQASLEATLTDGTKVQLASADIEISENDYLPLSFSVPKNLATLELQIDAQLKAIAGRADSSLSIKKPLPVTPAPTDDPLAHGYFYQVGDQWMHQSLGRNGEVWADEKLTFSVTHRHFKQPIELDLVTDAQGKIKLGALPDISSVRVAGDQTHAASELNPSVTGRQLKLANYYNESDTISVTLQDAPAMQRTHYSLIAIDHGHKNYFDSLQLTETARLSISDLPVGKYSLSIRGYQPHVFEVVDTKEYGAWMTRKGEAIESSTSRIPHITGAAVLDGKLIIDVDNHSVFSRIHIVGSQFSAAAAPFQPDMPTPAPTSRQTFGFEPSIYKNGGTLSGEHQYILNRRSEGNKLGNMLERPAWHLHPWHSNDSESHDNGALESKTDGRGNRSAFGSGTRSDAPASMRGNTLISAPITFLDNPAVILSNLTLNDEGKLVIGLDKLHVLKRVDIILTQNDYSDSLRASLPDSALETRDLRLTNSLDSKIKYAASETRAQLKKGAQAKITNVLDAKWKAYTKLADVFSYFHSHAPDPKHRDALNDLSPILHWPQLSQAERMLLLSESACHELHLFIKHRDPEWFAQHIAPQLTLKRRKSFIDHYLLDHDLSSYAELASYHNLNTMEQALLAQRLQSEPMRAELKARYLRNKPSNEANSATFAALLSQGFESELDQYKPLMAGSSAFYKRKLAQIVIPEVNFQNVSLEQALDVLRSRAIELDSTEIDPARKGVSLFIGNSQSADTRAKRIPALQLSNVPLQVALQQVADATGTRYRVTNGGVEFLAATDAQDSGFHTRSFQVPRDFIDLLGDGNGGSLKDLLASAGVAMPEGAEVSFSPDGVLVVRNTVKNLDVIDRLTATLNSPSAKENSFIHDLTIAQSKRLAAPAEAPSISTDDAFAEDVDAFADDDRSSFSNQPIVDPDSLPHQTKSYAESYYYQREWSASKQEIPVNQFWVDLAHWDGESDFLSPHFADCSNSRHEALVALAMMGLPFESEEIDVKIANNTMTVTAKQPMLLYYKDLHESAEVAKDSALLSSLRYFWSGDHFSIDENGKKSENAITGDFRAQVLYDAQLVITNPSGIEREIDILRQIPQGSIRLGDSESLASIKTTIPPRGTWTHTVQFYFPQAGEFSHYPAQIHADGKSVSDLKPQTLTVKDELEVEFNSSWAQLTASGSDQEVLAALKERDLHTIDPRYLASRMENAAFYKAASQILRSRMVDDMSLDAFAIQHRDLLGVKELLGDLNTSGNIFGYYVESDLLQLTPHQTRRFDESEWRPLINPRAFSLTDQNRITNTKVWDDYLSVLNQLVWKNQLGSAERLTLAYHLYLHDRNDEANLLVESCKREDTDAVMQFDYLTCYRHFLKGDAQAASQLAAQWVDKAQTPWKQRFEAVVKQAEQVLSSALLATDEAEPRSDKWWSASLTAGNVLRVEHQNMQDIVVQVYPVDLEFLFSSTPFLTSSDSSYKAIRPLQVFNLELAADKPFTELTLPESYQNGDRLLVIDDGEKEWLQTLQSSKLKTVADRKSGVLQALSADDKPLPRCYVKVYALDSKQETHFYKDGHTDLRGMFDFRSHNLHAPNSIKKFAIFISHPELGSITHFVEM